MASRSYDHKRPDIAYALANGWQYVRLSGSGHLVFAHPGVKMQCVLPCTLGGGRGDRNGIAWLKRNTPREATA